MTLQDLALQHGRRRFLTDTLSGAGAFALTHLLHSEGFSASRAAASDANPLAAQLSHFAPKAKNCIYIYLEGGPSQMDLFDPKPKLNELDGQPLPESMAEDVQFAFLQKETARIKGTPRTFRKYGECGMDFSELLPHIATCADDITMIRSMQTDQFNHVPGSALDELRIGHRRPAQYRFLVELRFGQRVVEPAGLRRDGDGRSRRSRRIGQLVERVLALGLFGRSVRERAATPS